MEETDVNLSQDMMGQMKAFMDMQKGGTKKPTLSTKNILSSSVERLINLVKMFVKD